MAKLEYLRTDKNGTEYYADYTCRRCGGHGGAKAWAYTGWTCYECGGTGIAAKPSIVKKYTPEYEAVLAERRAKRAEKARQERLAEIRSHMDETYASHGFGPDGKQYAVVERDSYTIKDELKEAGARWDSNMKRWTFPQKPEKWQTVEVAFDELYEIDETYGSVDYRYDVDAKALVNSRIQIPESTSVFVGEVGKRATFDVTLIGTRSWEISDPFGRPDTQTLYMFEDTDGNSIVWKTTSFGISAGEHPVGSRLSIKGTVKDHKEYKGVKQTVLQRVSVVA